MALKVAKKITQLCFVSDAMVAETDMTARQIVEKIKDALMAEYDTKFDIKKITWPLKDDEMATAMKNKALELLTRAWQDGHISNYNYLLRLNAISGRSFHDPSSYPIMP